VSDVAVRAVVALGANLGDREASFRAALEALGDVAGVHVVAVSTPVESIALTLSGLDESKPAYLNAVAVVETTLSPVTLLEALNRIEDDLGRVRVERWGDRTLDLDLIAHGDATLDTPRLTLPHPRAAERSFVLAPWLEIEPDAVLPGAGRVDELLDALAAAAPPTRKPSS
jgi:2-amino-4-hydroxy-6-hydroxymethyldihydropteridine diphosphokinase